MGNVKKYWEKLPQYKRKFFLKKYHLWIGLINFSFKEIPKDVKSLLKQEMKEKENPEN